MSIETSSFNKIKNQHIEHGGGGLVAESCLDSHDPMEYSSWDSSVHGSSQARILEWLPLPSLGDLPDPGTEPQSPELQAVSCIIGRFFRDRATWQAEYIEHIYIYIYIILKYRRKLKEKDGKVESSCLLGAELKCGAESAGYWYF